MYGYIYRITDLTNGKCYIGQRKWNKPGIDLNYWGSGTIISNIVRKRKKEDRMDTLLREKLMDCATLEELNYFETYFIEHLNTLSPNGYNLNTGGDVRKGGKRSIETRQKMSKARKGWVPSEETRQKWSEQRKGKHTGKDNSMYGVHRYGEQAPGYGKNKYGLTEEFLYEEYVIKNKSQQTIAAEVGCSQGLVGIYLKKYSIEKDLSICFTQEQLYNLYVKDNLTISFIADLLGCSSECIRHKLKKYKISKK